jgi:hypothetical protein
MFGRLVWYNNEAVSHTSIQQNPSHGSSAETYLDGKIGAAGSILQKS